jgi:hypothetical protein
MSDLIFKTDGKETSRIPSRTIQELTIGTKCPETKLEVKKMTETDISKVLIEGDYATIVGVKYKRVEEPKSPVEEAYKRVYNNYPPTTLSVSNFEDTRWRAFELGYRASQEDGVFDEPTKPMSEVMDRLENKYKDAEENAASYITDEVVDRMLKKYQAQKLWNRVRDELGYSIDCCDEIVNLVESWLPEPQNASGSQNVDTELLVDGHNHCLNKMKEMLR